MNKKGISTIIVIIIISAISLIFTTSVGFLGLGNLEMSDYYLNSKKALYLADSCLNDVLIKIKNNNLSELNNYSLSIFEGLCIINVEDKEGEKNIYIKANFNSYYRNIEAIFNPVNNYLKVSYK